MTRPGPPCERSPMRTRVLAFLGTAAAALATACGPSSKGEGCADDILAGDLVITEVFADFKAPPGGAGTDEGKEWFEIYNAGDRPIELEGMTVVHSRPDGSRENLHIMDKVTIGPEQYLTLGNSVPDLLPAYIDYGYSADLGDLFNSDGGKLALRCGDTEVDAATYDGVVSGRSRQLTAQQPPDYTLNDVQVNWCEATATEFDTANFGTPGSESDCTPVVVGQCNDGAGMRDVVTPAAGELVITELMPNPFGSADIDTGKEWFEVKAMADVDLNGLGIDRLNTTTTPDVIESPDCIRVTAGSYVVFARSFDPAVNGTLPSGAVLATFSKTSLVQTAGDLQLLSNGNVVDAITWTGSREGASIALDPDLTDTGSNDSPGNFCDGTTAYNADMDKGTPGGENGQCTILPPPGMCDDAGTLRAVVKPVAGQLVINEFLSNAAGTGTPSPDQTQEFVELVNTGATPFDLNGLTIKVTSASSTINVPECKTVPAGGFALLAHSVDPAVNGGLMGVDATFPGSLNIGSQVSMLDGMIILDAVTGISGSDGVSDQLRLDKQNVTDNDMIANFCKAQKVAEQKYGPLENYGTPKAANVCP